MQVELRGHTDNSNKNPSENFILGSKRAEAIADLLIKQGVNQEQLVIISFGDHTPLTRNKSDTINNRVEFRIRTDDKDDEEKQLLLKQWNLK